MKKIRLEINDEAGLYGKISLLDHGWYMVTLLDLDSDEVVDRIRCDDYQLAVEHLQRFVWNYEDPRIICQTA